MKGKRIKESTANTYSTAVSRIVSHPQYDVIIKAMKEGVSVKDILGWIVDEGHLGSVTRDTFYQYLIKFRVERPDLIKSAQSDDDIDEFVDSKRPGIDSLKELDRLIRLQKKRLKIGMTTETNMAVLLNAMTKEVDVTAKLLELRGKMDGTLQLTANKKRGDDFGSLSIDAKNGLDKLQADEKQREHMASLSADLMNSLREADAKKKKKIRVSNR
jgi:hypothetical protein